MATHDEQDVRNRRISGEPRARVRSTAVAPIRTQTEASIVVPMSGPLSGAMTGSRLGPYGAIAGTLAGAAYYAYNNQDKMKALLGMMAVPVVRSYNILSSYFDEMSKGKNKGKNKGNTAKPTPAQPAPAQPAPAPQPEPAQEGTATGSTTTAQPTTASGTAAPAPQPERNDSTSQRRPSWRERLGDRIAGRSSGQPTGGNTPPDKKGSLLGRVLWETENNNFGPNWWGWRNAGRVGLSVSYPAREYVWPKAGEILKYMVVGPDSVPTEKPNPTPETPPTTTTEAPIRIYPVAPTDTLTNLLD